MKRRGRGRPTTRGHGVGTNPIGTENTQNSVKRSSSPTPVAQQQISPVVAGQHNVRQYSNRISTTLQEKSPDPSQDIVHRSAQSVGTRQDHSRQNSLERNDHQKHSKILQQTPADENQTPRESLKLPSLTGDQSKPEEMLNKIRSQMRLIQAQKDQSNKAPCCGFQRARSLLYPGSPIFRNTGLVIRSVPPKVRNNFYPYRPAQTAGDAAVNSSPISKVKGQDGRTLSFHDIAEHGSNGHQKSVSDQTSISYRTPAQQQSTNPQDNANVHFMESSSENVNAAAAAPPNLVLTTNRSSQIEYGQNGPTTLHVSAWLPSEINGNATVANQETVPNMNLETKESELSNLVASMHLTSPLAEATPSTEYVTNSSFKDALASAFVTDDQRRASGSCSENLERTLGDAPAAKIIKDMNVVASGGGGGGPQGDLHSDFGRENRNNCFQTSNQNVALIPWSKSSAFRDIIRQDANKSCTFRDLIRQESQENEENIITEAKSKMYQNFKNPRPDADAYFFLIDNNQPAMFRPIHESFKTSTDIAVAKLLKPMPRRPVVGSSTEVANHQTKFNQEEARENLWTSSGASCGPLALNIKVETPKNKMHCVGCKRVFRWPHLLTCCHSLCYACIVAKYDNQFRMLKCLICHKITKLPEGIDSLEIDMPLCMELVSANISPFLCTSCEQEKEAHHYCSTCKKFLCHVCLPLHKTHAVKPAKVVHEANGDVVHYCDDHAGIPVVMYCRTCPLLVCKYCINGKHSTHVIWTIDTAADEAAKEVKRMKTNIDNMQMGCRKQIQNLNNVKQQMEDKDKRVRNEIHRICNSLIDTINSSEKVSRMLVNKAHDEIVEQVQQMVGEVNDYKTLYEHSQELAPRYIQQNNVEEFSLCLDHILTTFDTLDKFYSTSPLAKPNFNVDIKFQPDYREFDEAVHDCFDNIHFEHNIRMDSPTLLDRGLSPIYCLNNAELAENDFGMRNEQEAGASVDESAEVDDADIYSNFTRITTPYSKAFGKYGRGQYEFIEPCGVLYLHDGTLAVCDAKNHRITVFDPEGIYIRSIGETKLSPIPDTPETDSTLTRVRGKLCYPYRAAQCPRSHNIVVVERPPSLFIQIFSFDGEFVASFGEKKLSYPRGLAVDECGFIFVVESRTMKFFIFDQNGDEIAQKFLASHLQFPNDIVARRGKIYISDNRSHCVHIFDYDLNCLGSIGNESLTYFPIGVALSHSDLVVVTDNHNTFNITVFDQSGQLVCGFKSRSKHANCYNVALHPARHELAVTTKDCKVLIFNFEPSSEVPR